MGIYKIEVSKKYLISAAQKILLPLVIVPQKSKYESEVYDVALNLSNIELLIIIKKRKMAMGNKESKNFIL